MKFYAKEFNHLTTSELYEILKSRAKVFFLEQKIVCLDMDNVDYRSTHLFLEEDGQVVAYLRAFYKDDDTVKIGRVLTLHHGSGIGRQLMENALSYIKREMPCRMIYVESQKHAEGFYAKFGFRTVSEEFLEADIPHVAMELPLISK